MKPLMNEWHCNSRGSTYKVYKLSIPPMWTHWNFRILSCCFGILLECHQKAMVFAGDFNEDESGPIVRSLDLKPGDAAPWMEWFFFSESSLRTKDKISQIFPLAMYNLSKHLRLPGEWDWVVCSWPSPCRSLWSKAWAVFTTSTDIWSPFSFWKS